MLGPNVKKILNRKYIYFFSPTRIVTKERKLSYRERSTTVSFRLLNPVRIFQTRTKPDVFFSQKGMESNAYRITYITV